MRFFEQQEIAKRNSRILTFLFIINVIVLSIINALAVGYYFKFDKEQIIYAFIASTIIFVCATAISLIGSRAGTSIATSLGGRALQSPIKDLAEKRLYNVVEEMAIASGVPIPYIYILDSDDSINAFAAGTDPKHLVVAVTRGALVKLTREELQAVIGHEFSHILHEDMELNVRTTGIVSGFYIFMRMGLWVLKNSGDSRSRRSRGNATAVVGVTGLSFLIFGSVGYFLARVIQSFISKQREFLADASSAQYTRNPQALARALAKIGYHSGSEISSPNRLEVSHIFFAEGMKGFWTSVFSTHPKIEDRIKSLLPNVSLEKFVNGLSEEFSRMENDHMQIRIEEEEILQKKNVEKRNFAESFLKDRKSSADFILSLASPALGHFRYTEDSLSKIPASLREQIRRPDQAKMALFVVLLFTQTEKYKDEFLKIATEQHPEQINFITECLDFCSKNMNLRLMFFKVVLGILRQSESQEHGELMVILKSFFLQDQKINLLEGLYYIICESVLTLERPKEAMSQIKDLRQVSEEIFRLLLACEFSEIASGEQVKNYYEKIKTRVVLFSAAHLKLPTEFKFNLVQFKNDLSQLNKLNLSLKQKLVMIFYENFKTDQSLSQQESEILSMILLYLKIPVPPMFEKELASS